MRWPSRHRSKVQSRRFHDAMVGVYERVSAACPGYRLTAFLAMTRDRGGLTAARALLHPERGVSEGLGNERDVSQRSLAVRAVRLLYRGLKPKTASGPGFSSSSRALLMRCHGRKYVGVAVVRAPSWLWFFSFETFSTRNHNPVGDSPTILPATIHTPEDPVARGPKPKIEKTSSSDSQTASHLPSSSIMAAYLVGRIVCSARSRSALATGLGGEAAHDEPLGLDGGRYHGGSSECQAGRRILRRLA